MFRYISTQENPADLATRGKVPSELNSSIWWNGPPWLSKPESLWPESKFPELDKDSEEAITEVTGSKVLFEAKLVAGEDPTERLKQKINLSDINIEKFSSLQRLLRVTSWIIKYVNKFMKTEHESGPLNALELQRVKLLWELYIQQKHYANTIDKIIQGKKDNLQAQLNLKIDKNGVIRCHGRFSNSDSTQGAKEPEQKNLSFYPKGNTSPN